MIAQMAKVKDSYNCDAIAIAAACAALDDVAYARANWQAVRVERKRLSSELERRRLAVIPSQANFLLVTTPEMGALPIHVNLCSGLRELRCLLFQSLFDCCFFRDSVFGRVLPDIFGYFHAAEMGTAHRAEMS